MVCYSVPTYRGVLAVKGGCVACDKVVAITDGVAERSTTMDYQLSQPTISHQNSSLFLGHSRSVSQRLPNVLHCQLGNVFLF